jgi:DNA topoisomerase-1
VIEDYSNGRTLKYFEREINLLLKKAENLSKAEIGVLCMLRNRLKEQ